MFSVEVSQAIPRLVNLDPLRVHQLVSNGLTNAIKVGFSLHSGGWSLGSQTIVFWVATFAQHTVVGEIKIRVSIIPREVQPNVDSLGRSAPLTLIRFEILDTGSGLSGIDPTLLFEPFSQGKAHSSSTKRAQKPSENGRPTAASATSVHPTEIDIDVIVSVQDMVLVPRIQYLAIRRLKNGQVSVALIVRRMQEAT